MKNSSNKMKFYLVQRNNSSIPDYIRTIKNLKLGRIYTLENGSQAKVIRQVHLKYSLEDVQNIADILKGGYEGTQQYKLWLKMKNIIKSQIPRLRFSDTEREIIYYIYVNNEYSTNEQKVTLEKVLNIRR